ncbi:MAG TPA: hypothetical protein VFT53_03850 [Candidatus Saccharimonadales bacterium]|nr:hypothetical protein [Candidatus Saccharimonadales bacterium]
MGLFDALRMMMGGSKHPADTPPPTGVITPAGPTPGAPATPEVPIQPSAPDMPTQTPSTNPTTTVPVAEPPANNTVIANDSTEMPSITPEPTDTKTPETGAAIVSPGDTSPAMPNMSDETPTASDGSQSQGPKPGNPLPPQA